jgi:pilus assembly protein CpaF
MGLRESLQSNAASLNAYENSTVLTQDQTRLEIQLRSKIHQRLLGILDLSVIETMSDSDLKAHLKGCIEKIVIEDQLVLNDTDLARLIVEIQNEITGLGPLESLLADPTISDILVNNARSVYVERKGKLEKTLIHFDNDAHLLKIIDKIVARVGRRIDESSPMVDARLPDGSRINAIIPPLALDGPVLSIRRFSEIPLKMGNLVEFGSLTNEMAVIIAALVKAKTNILVSGGTGSGKTTLLNIMSGFIPDSERIVTIEDAAELRLQQPHVVRLETRPPNIEGKGEVNQRALLRNTLRMRPDRIIVGEVRGIEVLDMLQAMNTGHEGSLTTVHANSARDSLTRLENMIGIAGLSVMLKPLRQQIVAAISVIVHIARLSDGKRKITGIHEITGMEGEMITMQEIFRYDQTGVAPDGTVLGHFRATGIRPRFAERLLARGAPLADYLFDPDRSQE